MKPDIYFWIAAYYTFCFTKAACWLTEQYAHMYGIAWRIIFWLAFYLCFRYRRDRAGAAIGINMPDRRMLCAETVVLFMPVLAQAAIMLCRVSSSGAYQTDIDIMISGICESVSAAAIEEILFRGVILFGSLMTFRIKTVYAITASAMLFSAAHFVNLAGGNYTLSYTIQQAVLAFCAGISLGALSVYTKSIVPAIILHATINLADFAPLFGAGANNGIRINATAAFAALYLVVGALIMRRQEKEVQ